MSSEKIIAALSKIRPGSTFLTIRGYKTQHGDVADYNIIFHYSYPNALQRSIQKLDNMDVEPDLAQTKLSIKQRLVKSLINPNPDVVFEPVTYKGKVIPGLKRHVKTKELYLTGLLVNKRIIKQGLHKKNHSDGQKLEKHLPINKIRQFKLSADLVESIKVDGKIIKL